MKDGLVFDPGGGCSHGREPVRHGARLAEMMNDPNHDDPLRFASPVPARLPAPRGVTPVSVLDLVPVVEGGSVAAALAEAGRARADRRRLGYHRFWVAEHHGMAGVAGGSDRGRRSPISATPPRPSASAPAGSCCPTTTRSSSPSSSARSTALFPAGSTSGSAAPRAPRADHRPDAAQGPACRPPSISRRTWSSCARC